MNPVLSVPTIDKRKRIPASAIRAVTRQIAEKFKPQKIILFGSYARGKPRQYSDVDLLIIMEAPVKSLEIRHYLGVMFALDLLVYTPERLKERVKMGDSFIRDILKEGKVLCELPGR